LTRQNLPLYLGSVGSGLLRDEFRHAIDWLGSRCRGSFVVDIACGQGLIPLLLAREGFTTLGLDTEPAQIERAIAARGEQPDHVAALSEFRLREIGLESIDDGAAGTVVVGTALTGLAHPERLVADCERILKPDGRLIVIFNAAETHPTLRDLAQLFSQWQIVDSYVGAPVLHGVGETILVLERSVENDGDSAWVDVASRILAGGAPDRTGRGVGSVEWSDGVAPALLFVISTGRAGSQSIAHEYGLLHEPDGPNPSLDGVAERSRHRFFYGETSHFWKNQIPSLKGAFPHASLIHLVRDGRNVVKSFQSRGHYNDAEGELPYRNEPLPPHRPGMSAFERICWYWAFWNEEIECHADRTVLLEDLALGARTNIGAEKAAWTEEEQRIFAAVCGDLMRHYGYW
jgi:ubiquinone/menaquinone biosynthesis C-methylase UbiE